MNLAYSSDTDFIAKIKEITLQNLGNENFGVNELAKNAGVNHTYLSKRLHKITNKSVSRFISEVRLEKAAEILRNEGVTAAEAAYKVGFGSATYFNKCFHDFYGFPPGDLRKGNHLEPIDDIAKPEIMDKKRNYFLRGNKTLFIVSVSAIFVILLFVSVWYFYINKGESTKALKLGANDKSIAVLPFENLNKDSTNQYFASGITESIINNLSLVKDLKVISRTSSELYCNREKSASKIGKELGVRLLLEGSVQQYSGKFLILVRLIDAKTDITIWSEEYKDKESDIFSIQSTIAMQVAEKLGSVIGQKELKQIGKILTTNQEALICYQKARQFFNIRGESLIRGKEYFEKAIALDPEFAEAYSGLAALYEEFRGGLDITKAERFNKTREFTQKALSLDQNLAEAHALLGRIYFYDWKWKEAEKEFERAILLNPNSDVAYFYYVDLLIFLGEWAKARNCINKAIELNPNSAGYSLKSARLYSYCFDYQNALTELKKTTDINPEWYSVYYTYFKIYFLQGNDSLAAISAEKALSLVSDTKVYAAQVNETYQKSGIKGVLRLMIDAESVDETSGDMGKARNYSMLGENEKALYYLEEVAKSVPPGVLYINYDPDCKNIANEPRFNAILQKMGLPNLLIENSARNQADL